MSGWPNSVGVRRQSGNELSSLFVSSSFTVFDTSHISSAKYQFQLFHNPNDASSSQGLISLALLDSDKLDKPAHAKSYLVDTSPKDAEYIFRKNGCSSFLIRCCLKKS